MTFAQRSKGESHQKTRKYLAKDVRPMLLRWANLPSVLHGRLLAWVWADNALANLLIVQAGRAVPYIRFGLGKYGARLCPRP